MRSGEWWGERWGGFARLDPTPPEVRRRMQEILERGEFRRHRSLWQRFWDWIGPDQNDPPPNVRVQTPSQWGGPIGSIILWVLIVLLLIGVTVLVVRIVRSRRPRPKKQKPTAPTVDVEEERDADEWAGDAERLEAAGEWKEALRCRYRELVARLVELGDVSPMAGRTTGELARDVAATVPEVAAPFAALTELFELPWYAHADTGPAENLRFRELAAQVLAVAERTRDDRSARGRAGDPEFGEPTMAGTGS